MSTPAGNQGQAASTGFIVVEQVLGELQTKGRSGSIDKWSAQLRDGLAKFKDANKSPKAAKEAQAVEKAFEGALELVQVMRQTAK